MIYLRMAIALIGLIGAVWFGYTLGFRDAKKLIQRNATDAAFEAAGSLTVVEQRLLREMYERATTLAADKDYSRN